jgi:hypothetical protein
MRLVQWKSSLWGMKRLELVMSLLKINSPWVSLFVVMCTLACILVFCTYTFVYWLLELFWHILWLKRGSKGVSGALLHAGADGSTVLCVLVVSGIVLHSDEC